MAWFDLDAVQCVLTPWEHRQDLSTVMKAAATNVGMQQWKWGCLSGARAMSVSVADAETLDTFVFGDHKPTYGAANPFQELLVAGSDKIDKVLNNLKVGEISWDPVRDFLIVLHLRSHNRILIRKLPKDWRAMFGTREARDHFLTVLCRLGQYPMELRLMPGW